MKRNYLTIEGPDKSATIDFLNPAPLRDANVTITREGDKLRISVKVINPGYDTWEEQELEINLSLP